MLHSAYNFLPQGHITDVQRLRTNFLPLNNRFSPVLSVYRCHGGKYTTNHQPKFLTREGPSYHLGNSWQSCSLNSLKIISPLEILVHPIFGKSLFQKWIIANIYLWIIANIYLSVPGTALSTLCILTHLIITQILWDEHYFYAHFVCEETKA